METGVKILSAKKKRFLFSYAISVIDTGSRTRTEHPTPRTISLYWTLRQCTLWSGTLLYTSRYLRTPRQSQNSRTILHTYLPTKSPAAYPVICPSVKAQMKTRCGSFHTFPRVFARAGVLRHPCLPWGDGILSPDPASRLEQGVLLFSRERQRCQFAEAFPDQEN